VDEIVERAEAGAESVRARVKGAIDTTRPATYEDVRDLQAELRALGRRLAAIEERLPASGSGESAGAGKGTGTGTGTGAGARGGVAKPARAKGSARPKQSTASSKTAAARSAAAKRKSGSASPKAAKSAASRKRSA
jgi:hypothetical protein